MTDALAGALGAWIVAVSGATLFLLLWRSYSAIRRRVRLKSVFASSFLHTPGFARRHALRLHADECHALLATVALLPFFFGGALLAQPAAVVSGFSAFQLLAIVMAVTAIAGYFLHSLIRVSLELPALRYALQADMAVCHGLDRISRRDYCVFHDFECDGVTHAKIVVGKRGVFVLSMYVQRRKGRDRHRMVSARFEAGGVVFPDGTAVPLKEFALDAARRVERHLSTATGKPVTVCPVLVMPGWRIECAEQPAFPIVNEQNIDMIASWTRPESHLLDEEFDGLRNLLTEACRDPRFTPCGDDEKPPLAARTRRA